MVKTNSVKAWLLATRPKTLSAAAVPVMIGTAFAWRNTSEQFNWIPAILCLLFAWIMQIDSNLVNDYFDFKKGRFIGLENLQDPSNLGAIARSCEALGADGILISKGSCDPYSPKSLRASMGTLLRMPVFTLADFSKEIAGLGLKTYACVVDTDAQNFGDIKFSDGSVLIIGNEANGITDETKSVSDMKITIPMKGNAESLNAAVAASIAMWEMMK